MKIQRALLVFVLMLVCRDLLALGAFQPVIKFTSGYIGTVGVVTDENNHPILAEYGSDGKIKKTIGSYGVGEYVDTWIMSGASYRQLQELYKAYMTEHGEGGDGLAVGARLMPVEQYDNLQMKTNAKSPQPVTKPELRRDDTKSVLVVSDKKLLTANPPYEGIVLMEFPVNLLPDEELQDIAALIIDDDGNIVYRSKNDISYKVELYKDYEATNGFERMWEPLPGIPVEGLYSSGGSSNDGKYRLTEVWPPCPGFHYSYSYSLVAKVYYTDFNPKNRDQGGSHTHYVPVTKPSFVTCSGIAALLASQPNLVGQMTALTVDAIESKSKFTLTTGYDFNIPVIPLYTNVKLKDVTIGANTEYQSDDAAIPDLSNSDYRFDFDGDGELDRVVSNPQDSGKVDIYLNGREEYDDQGERNPPDLTRLADSVLDPQLVDQGLLKTISREDLEDSDIYVYRESTGQLVNSTKDWTDKAQDSFFGLSGRVVEGPDWQGFNYSTMVVSAGDPGTLFREEEMFNYGKNRPWDASEVGDGLSTEPPDFLRIGEVMRVIAINRKTGYIGTAKFRLTSVDLEFDPAHQMTLSPPNLKVIATRTYQDEAGLTKDEQHNNRLIGNEGAGLASDTYVKIQTLWLDQDGTPLPEDLEGYTGRLAVSTGSGTRDFSGNFEIKPGYRTQVVQLNNAADLTTEHFYVQVVGEYINDNPSFASPGAGPGKLQTRPKYYVPIKVPVYDEPATVEAQNALAQARRDGVEGLPDAVDPVYHWVYRPEMQFSVYDFKVNEIRQEIAANEFVNIYPAGADDDPNTIPVLSGDYDITQILYELTGKGEEFDLERFGPDRELILTIGEQEHNVTASINQNGELTFENMDHLALLDVQDYLTIRLYQNNDAANVLWEFAFEYLTVDTTEDFDTYPGVAAVYVEADSEEDLKIELAAELIGYLGRPDDEKEMRTVKWRVEGDGSIEQTTQSDNDTGIFENTLIMQPFAGATATVYVSLDGNPEIEASFGEVVVLPGVPTTASIRVEGEAYTRGAGDAQAVITATDAYGNAVFNGTMFGVTTVGAAYAVSNGGLVDGGAGRVKLAGGLSSGTQSVSMQLGGLTREVSFEVKPLTVSFSAVPASSGTNQLQDIVVNVMAGGEPAQGVFVDVGSDAGKISYQSLQTDSEGNIAIQWHTGALPGIFNLYARTDEASQAVAQITVSEDDPTGARLTASNRLVVGNSAATSIDMTGYEGAIHTFGYQNSSIISVFGDPDTSYDLTLNDLYHVNREPLLLLPLNGLSFDDRLDITGLNKTETTSLVTAFDSAAGVGSSTEFNGMDSKLVIPLNPATHTANGLIKMRFKPLASGSSGVLINHHGAHKLKHTGDRIVYDVRTDAGDYQLTSQALTTGIWHRISASIQDGVMRLDVDGQQASQAIAGFPRFTDTRGLVIGEGVNARMSDIAYYNLDSNPLLLFENGQESISVTTNPAGVAHADLQVNAGLGDQYLNSQVKHLNIAVAMNDQHLPLTLMTREQYGKHAQHYYDAFADTAAFATLDTIIPQAVIYRDDGYIYEKLLDRASDHSSTFANVLQAAFATLEDLPEMEVLGPYLADLRGFYQNNANPVIKQSVTGLISDAVNKFVKSSDRSALDKLIVAFVVQGELLNSAPHLAHAMTDSVKSHQDFIAWINTLSLPAIGWIGGEAPVPVLDTNCPTDVGIWINAGTELAVPLIPCRMTGEMAGDLISAFMQNIDMTTEPELLSHSMADLYHELSSASVSFRKLILDPKYQQAIVDSGFFIKDAYAALPLAKKLLDLFTKLGKRGIKNFKALLKGNTNLRVSPVILLGATVYLASRVGEDACPNGSCVKLDVDNANIQFYKNVTKIFANAVMMGKFTNPRLNNGELSCKMTGDTHGAVNELLMTAFFHASYEFNNKQEHEILEIEKGYTFNIARGTKGRETEKRYMRDLRRRIDLVISGAQENPLPTFVEVKSLQSQSAKKRDGVGSVKGKFPQWTIRPKGKTTYHKQFLLDRLAITDTEPYEGFKQEASDYIWYFQDWKTKYTDKDNLDKGISLVRGECGRKKCFGQVKEQLLKRPKLNKGTKAIDLTWPDLDKPEAQLAHRNRIKGFNLEFELLKAVGDNLNMTDIPEEFREMEATADNILEKVETMEEQVKKLEELSKQELDKLDRKLKDNSAYRWLKEAFHKVDKAVEKAKKKAEEELGNLLDEIPELSLHCSD